MSCPLWFKLHSFFKAQLISPHPQKPSLALGTFLLLLTAELPDRCTDFLHLKKGILRTSELVWLYEKETVVKGATMKEQPWICYDLGGGMMVGNSTSCPKKPWSWTREMDGLPSQAVISTTPENRAMQLDTQATLWKKEANRKHLWGDSPGCPVAKNLHCHCRGHGFNPWLGN